LKHRKEGETDLVTANNALLFFYSNARPLCAIKEKKMQGVSPQSAP
jgi:hypothetical protein